MGRSHARRPPVPTSPLDEVKNKPDPPANLPHTMEAMAKWTKANYPVHVRLVESAGIAFKEYLIMGVALPAALSVESTMERGVQIPPDMRVNQANIAFVKSNNKSNKAKLTAMFAEFQQLMIGHK